MSAPAVQPPRLHATLNRPLRDADSQQLGVGDDAVLPAGDCGQRAVTYGLVELPTYVVGSSTESCDLARHAATMTGRRGGRQWL